jgi:hypothetical protein
MNWLDTLVISYVLDKQGVPFDLIEHFNDVLTQGIAAGEADSIKSHKQLVLQARNLAQADDLDTREAIVAVLDHINAKQAADRLQQQLPFLKVVSDIINSPVPETSLGCRMSLRRAASALAGLQGLAESA